MIVALSAVSLLICNMQYAMVFSEPEKLGFLNLDFLKRRFENSTLVLNNS